MRCLDQVVERIRKVTLFHYQKRGFCLIEFFFFFQLNRFSSRVEKVPGHLKSDRSTVETS